MPPTTSVVVLLDRDAHGLADLVHSLDAQSVAAPDFEVIFAGDSAAAAGRRLAELARRRPNISVLEGPLAAGADAAAGRWLLVLPTALCAAGLQLYPEALAQLAAFGVAQDAAAVLARVDFGNGSSTCDLLIRDTPRLDADPSDALDKCLVLWRTDFAREHGVGDAGKVGAALAAGNISAFGSYPAGRLGGGARPDSGAPTVEQVAAEWQDGAILLSVSGRAGAGTTDRSAVLSVRRRSDGLEFWLPGSGSVGSAGSFSVTARLDPHTAALGDPLTPGQWEVRVGVHGTGGAWSARTPVPATALNPGIVHGLLVAVDGSARSLVLDIGATRASVIGGLRPEQVTITETARGTELTVTLPDVTVTGTSSTRGHVLLGKFPLPATLETDAGRAGLSCFLSGLAGTSSMSTRFGGRAASTGLDLTIDGLGIMTVAPTPPAPPPTAAPTSLVGRLRRAVPPQFEPAVVRLSRNPTARRIYRRLSSPRAR